jgi:hypothetical protein
MKRFSHLLAVSLCLQSAHTLLASTVYIGSFSVADGPSWTTNPTVYSAREAAAFLFGGSFSDYAISTIANTTDPSTINHLAFVDGWGDGQYLAHPASEDFKLDSGGPGYNNPSGGPAYSAYVQDHSFPGQYVNYVWKIEASPSLGAASPLPAAALLPLPLLLALPLLRRRKCSPS